MQPASAEEPRSTPPATWGGPVASRCPRPHLRNGDQDPGLQGGLYEHKFVKLEPLPGPWHVSAQLFYFTPCAQNSKHDGLV